MQEASQIKSSGVKKMAMDKTGAIIISKTTNRMSKFKQVFSVSGFGCVRCGVKFHCDLCNAKTTRAICNSGVRGYFKVDLTYQKEEL